MPDPFIPADPGAPLGSSQGVALPPPKDYWAQENQAPAGQAPHPEYNPSPAEQVALEHVRFKETGTPEGDYSLLHGPGGMHVHDLSQFPVWHGFEGPAGQSHAAGGYGFEPGTYNEAAQNTGYSDFSPASQDVNALWLGRQYGFNSEHSWAASGPHPEPNGGRPVPAAAPQPPRPSGPQQLGPFQSKFDAYDAAPANRQNYMLLEQGGAYRWVPKSAVPDNGTGPSPYYNKGTEQQTLDTGILNSPRTEKGPFWGNLAHGMYGYIANLLDLPATLADAGLRTLSAGMGWQPPTVRFGRPVENLINKLGIETEKQGEGWAATLGYGIGSGLGMTATALVPGAAAARAGGLASEAALPSSIGGEALLSPPAASGAELASKAVGFNPLKPLSSSVKELSLGGGAGVAQQEAHEFYKGQTGREGDLGDLATQMLAGGALNVARTAVSKGIDKAWEGAHAGAQQAKATIAAQTAMGQPPIAPNSPEVQQFRAERGYDPNQMAEHVNVPLDPVTGRQVADQYFAKDLSNKLDVARDHVEALGTAPPEDSAAVMAEHSDVARKAVSTFLQSSRAEEAHMWSPEAGVNLDMPRDFTGTQNLYKQLQADHFSPDRLRDPASFPSQVGRLLDQLEPQDSLGRGQDVRSRIGQMIEDETAAQGRAPDSAKIGYLQKIRNSLADDLSAGGEGVNPQEIDAYRRAMATSAARAQLVESPEMRAFLQAGDAQALDKFIKTGPAGADAVKILTGAAEAKYGSTGLLDAASDAIRQKYSDAVAPHGYVSLNDHNRFMQRYSGLLDDPHFADVRQQFETAAESEQNLNNTVGFGRPGGFGKSGSVRDVREARAETYLNAPTRTVLNHLEGVSDQFSATRKALDLTGQDPTGAATLGLQHVIADRALYTPGYIQNNPGIIEAIDRVNDGFAQRLNGLMTPSSLGGIAKKLVDWGASLVGAKVGNKLAAGGMGSSLVMAGRTAEMTREIAKNGLEKLTGISSALAVDPRANDAWGRTMRGMATGDLAENSAQFVADMLLFHAYVPGFAFGNLPIGGHPGSGAPGNAPLPGGPTSGPAGQPWYKSLPSYAPGAGRT